MWLGMDLKTNTKIDTFLIEIILCRQSVSITLHLVLNTVGGGRVLYARYRMNTHILPITK